MQIMKTGFIQHISLYVIHTIKIEKNALILPSLACTHINKRYIKQNLSEYIYCKALEIQYALLLFYFCD